MSSIEWKLVKRVRRWFGRTGGPRISVYKSGRIGFNSAAFEMFGDSKPKYIHLLLAEEAGYLGFRPAQPDDPDAFRFTYVKNGKRHEFSAIPTLEAIGLAVDKGWAATPLIIDGVLAVDVSPILWKDSLGALDQPRVYEEASDA